MTNLYQPQTLTQQESEELLTTLRGRFEKNKKRHPGVDWAKVQAKLEASPEKLWSLSEMERTGGERDVIGSEENGIYSFFDCAAESPKGGRSLCYDAEALEARKEFKPESNALDIAAEMGVEILTEEQYRYLQQFGKFDAKTSSWLKTPEAIRKLGGAIFGDLRYDHVFIYHNGAQSYYAARGFRALLKV